MKRNRKLWSALLLVTLLCLSACTQREEAPAPTPTPVMPEAPAPAVVPEAEVPAETTPEPIAEPTPEPVRGPVNPLTGEAVSGDMSSLRPFAVQMNNHYDALPQCGISAAAIIYEMPEEGITRMTAIVPQTAACEHFGSVRSARPYHTEVAKTYDAIFVHWGASTRGYEKIYQIYSGDDVDFCMNDAAPYSYREPSRANRATEHTGFVTLDSLKKFLADYGRRTTHEGEKDYGLRFSDNVELTGGTAETMSVFYASKETDFAYDAGKGCYTMSQYGRTPYVDGDTNEVVEFKNVLFLRADIADEYSLASIALYNAKGSGILCCNGKQEPINWEHGDYDDCFHYYRADGSEVQFGVGRSFISIISYNDALTIQ